MFKQCGVTAQSCVSGVTNLLIEDSGLENPWPQQRYLFIFYIFGYLWKDREQFHLLIRSESRSFDSGHHHCFTLVLQSCDDGAGVKNDNNSTSRFNVGLSQTHQTICAWVIKFSSFSSVPWRSIEYFYNTKNNRDISNILTNYNCNLQMFPLNTVKRKGRDRGHILFLVLYHCEQLIAKIVFALITCKIYSLLLHDLLCVMTCEWEKLIL